MPSRKLDKLGQLDADLEDARTTVEELQLERESDAPGDRLENLHDALDHATDTVDDLANKDE